MYRKVANEKKIRDVATLDWPNIPGQFPKGIMASPNLPETPTVTVTVVDKVIELLQWRDSVDQKLNDINSKLEYLLNETLKSRQLESQETPRGTKLGNACFRLDRHHETIQGISQRLAAAESQVHRLTDELRTIKEANEVTVTFKSTRPQWK